MNALAQTVILFAPLPLSAAVPLILIFRGGSPRRAFWLCYASVVLLYLISSMLIPAIAFSIDRELGKSAAQWLPESTIMLPVIIAGFLFAALVVFPAWGLRAVLTRSARKPETPTHVA